MPIYEFLCQKRHLSEYYFASISDAKTIMLCKTCGEEAKKVISIPSMHFTEYDSRTGHKVFKGNPWEGTALEDSDGVNELRYKSTKAFVEVSKK